VKYIKDYKQYKESIVIDLNFQNVIDLLESFNVLHDTLLSSINAEEVNILNTLNLSPEFIQKLDLDTISDNIEFINSLSSIGLKKSDIKNSEDFQTFLNKPCRFMFLFDINANELENPEYLLFQTWNSTLNRWQELKMYRVLDNIKKFYDKLTSKTIEIIDDDNYIYMTSNGNEWELQNIEVENDVYKRVLRRDELEKLLSDKKIKIEIK
jgi:hypothetical protein